MICLHKWFQSDVYELEIFFFLDSDWAPASLNICVGFWFL